MVISILFTGGSNWIHSY